MLAAANVRAVLALAVFPVIRIDATLHAQLPHILVIGGHVTHFGVWFQLS